MQSGRSLVNCIPPGHKIPVAIDNSGHPATLNLFRMASFGKVIKIINIVNIIKIVNIVKIDIPSSPYLI